MKNRKLKITYSVIIAAIILILASIVWMIISLNNMYKTYAEEAENIKVTYFENDDYIKNSESEEISNNITPEVEKNIENEKSVETEKSKTIEKENNIKENEKKVVIPDPTFISPIDNDIIKDYSEEKLMYSETLKEWTTHNGIDIRAAITTVVKSAADGKVKNIKNDPRYGMTIIIEHVNGYETRYSNLLTAEFVNVGEEVKQGQTIGTVGKTASFEIVDESHLHFEMLKNNEYLNPRLFIQN